MRRDSQIRVERLSATVFSSRDVFCYLNDYVVMCCFGCLYFIVFLGLFVNFVGNIHGLIIGESCNPILVPLWCAIVALRTAWALTYNYDNKWDIDGDKYRQ